MRNVNERAEAARRAAYSIGDMLHEKQCAYGDVASMQLELWQVLLRQYDDGKGNYRIPHALMAHVPRLTRVFDRIGRIVANPAGDRAGEDPWRDLAGDAIIGVIMPRTATCHEPGCERGAHSDDIHAKVDASGVYRWRTRPLLYAHEE